MTTCTKCGEEKDDLDFSVDNSRSNGLSVWCRVCRRNYTLQNPDQIFNLRLQGRYGITIGQYELMLKLQNGVCAICGGTQTQKQNGKVTKLSVDHNHVTQKVRGLLCAGCNGGLAFVENKDWWIDRLEQAGFKVLSAVANFDENSEDHNIKLDSMQGKGCVLFTCEPI